MCFIDIHDSSIIYKTYESSYNCIIQKNHKDFKLHVSLTFFNVFPWLHSSFIFLKLNNNPLPRYHNLFNHSPTEEWLLPHFDIHK